MSIDDEWSAFNISVAKENDPNVLEDDEFPIESFGGGGGGGGGGIRADVGGGGGGGVGGTPLSSALYISTKTKISYLNVKELNISHLFWNIAVIAYHTPTEGVIKKQMKIISNTEEDLSANQLRLRHATYAPEFTDQVYYLEQVISTINNPAGRIPFKDVRKITIGLSKKDILSYRCKQKSAFYNCFVLIIRLKCNEIFKEFHVKIFNTGKMEIPGIQCEETYEKLLLYVAALLQPLHQFQEIDAVPLATIGENLTVLINSNFNCNYHINREKLVHILTSTYNIQCIYDPCSYPGVQCKFYYNHSLEKQTGSQISHEDKDKYPRITKVSFMIFRTGSVLIVGMCDDAVLHFIYDFLVKILFEEYHAIFQPTPACIEIRKAKKPRKKTIYLK